jgi:hypothetical protein
MDPELIPLGVTLKLDVSCPVRQIPCQGLGHDKLNTNTAIEAVGEELSQRHKLDSRLPLLLNTDSLQVE